MKARAKKKRSTLASARGTQAIYKTGLDMRHYTPIAMHSTPFRMYFGRYQMHLERDRVRLGFTGLYLHCGRSVGNFQWCLCTGGLAALLDTGELVYSPTRSCLHLVLGHVVKFTRKLEAIYYVRPSPAPNHPPARQVYVVTL